MEHGSLFYLFKLPHPTTHHRAATFNHNNHGDYRNPNYGWRSRNYFVKAKSSVVEVLSEMIPIIRANGIHLRPGARIPRMRGVERASIERGLGLAIWAIGG